jgi:hypothetical protein
LFWLIVLEVSVESVGLIAFEPVAKWYIMVAASWWQKKELTSLCCCWEGVGKEEREREREKQKGDWGPDIPFKGMTPITYVPSTRPTFL